MLTQEAMLTLAAELTGAQRRGDAESLAAIAWQLYGAVGEDLAEIARLRAAIYAAWDRPTGNGVTNPSGSLSGTGGAGRRPGSRGSGRFKALSQPPAPQTTGPRRRTAGGAGGRGKRAHEQGCHGAAPGLTRPGPPTPTADTRRAWPGRTRLPPRRRAGCLWRARPRPGQRR